MDITFKQVAHTYQPNTPFQQRALHNIDLNIKEGSYTAIVGHTGSGKSTLLQHMNALIKPTEGVVQIGDRKITAETTNKKLKSIRKQVGIVFQFPESQLFEETVEKDIMFGPKNFGVSDERAKIVAAEMIQRVGLDLSYLERSPFELSGGQMRRVAIAGVMAMEPDILVLDEPTAGLDPQGRKEMMEMFDQLHKKQGMTIVLVTHLMDDVASFADHMVVLENGTVVREGDPREIFQEIDWLQSKQLGVPTATAFAAKLRAKGMKLPELPLSATELADILEKSLDKGGKIDE